MTPLVEIVIGLLLLAIFSIITLVSYMRTENLVFSLVVGAASMLAPILLVTLHQAFKSWSVRMAIWMVPDADTRMQSARTHITGIIRDWAETTNALGDGWSGKLHITPRQLLFRRNLRKRLRFSTMCGSSYAHAFTPDPINQRIHTILHMPTLTPIQRFCWRHLVRTMDTWIAHAPRYSAHAVLQAQVRLRT